MYQVQSNTNKNTKNQDITGMKSTGTERLNKLTPNIESFEDDEHVTSGHQGDAPVSGKITLKSRKETEDAKKTKNYILINKQNLKKKNNNFKADSIEQIQIRNYMRLKAIELESMKAEMEILINNREELHNNIEKVTTELLDVKNNNILIESILKQCQDAVDFIGIILNENILLDLLCKILKEKGDTIAEKYDDINRSLETKINLMEDQTRKYKQKITEMDEQIKTEKEKNRQRNKELEERIIENLETIMRKEEFINHQNYVISSLEDKLSLLGIKVSQSKDISEIRKENN